jgi:fucose permease
LLLAASLAVTAIALALAPLMTDLIVLTGVMFVLGIGEASLDVGANLLLVWVHKARATPYLNGLHFFFGLGALIAPMVVAQALRRAGGLVPGFWLMGLIALPIAAALLRLASPASPHTDAAAATRPVNWLLVGMLSAMFLVYVGAEVGFGGWIFTYTTELGLGDVASAAYLTSGFWGALMAGRLLIIPIASRFRPERLLLADFIGCIISMAIILLLPGSYWAVWAGALGLGMSMASVFPTLLAYADRRMNMTGQVSRWFFVGTGAGGMFLPWLMGRLFSQAGAVSVMWAVMIDMVAGLGLFFVIMGMERGKNELRVKETSA